MREAVARGELRVVRQEAQFLVALGGDRAIDAAWRDRLEGMRLAAASLAEATNIPEASVRLGAVARTCGECHATLGGPRPAVAALPDPGPDVRSRMKRHGWAVARMWDGLVVPSTPAWKAGAHVLSDAPLQPALITPDQSAAAEIVKFDASVHDLARKAYAAESGAERSAIYGGLMTTCSDCHARLGGGPGARGLPSRSQ